MYVCMYVAQAKMYANPFKFPHDLGGPNTGSYNEYPKTVATAGQLYVMVFVFVRTWQPGRSVTVATRPAKDKHRRLHYLTSS